MIQNTQISVTLSPKLRLKQALKKAGVENPATITKLTIAGIVTEKDFEYICQNMADTLQELDISNTSVTEIDEWTFYKVTVTEIGDYAFNSCTGLTSIAIPISVTKIDNLAFSNCKSLTSITVHPDNPVYSSESGVLFNKEKTELVLYPKGRKGDYTIPASIKKIERVTFRNCIGLTSVTIPISVTKIDNLAFSNCKSLTSITAHPDNPVYSSENGVLFNKSKTKLICIPRMLQGDYTIPDSVTKIGNIEFSDCIGLTSVTIPISVTKIDNWAFADCESLTAITVHPDNPVYSSESGVLFNKEKTELVLYPKGRKGDYTIPASIKKIERVTFRNCIGLTSITIPNSVTEIGKWTFDGCTGLTSIAIPASVTEIGECAFNDCKGLTSVTIPNSVTKIDNWAFDDCESLTSITVHPDNPVYSSENGVLFNKEKTVMVLYPEGRKGNYIIPDTVMEIGEYAFGCCKGLTSVTIPASVTKIGFRAFAYCTGLTSIIVHPDNPVYSSESGVLFNEDKTELVLCPEGRKGNYTIPDSVMEIGFRAFAYCTGLTSVTIPISVTKIDNLAFSDCESLTSITISDSIPETKEQFLSGKNEDLFNLATQFNTLPFFYYDGQEAKPVFIFYPERQQGNCIIPASITEIGEDAFEGCYCLTSVTIPALASVIKNPGIERLGITGWKGIDFDEEDETKIDDLPF